MFFEENPDMMGDYFVPLAHRSLRDATTAFAVMAYAANMILAIYYENFHAAAVRFFRIAQFFCCLMKKGHRRTVLAQSQARPG